MTRTLQLVLCLSFLLSPLTASAQSKENRNSAISRNLEIFNDIYKQLDLFYVDTLNADSVIGTGIRAMLRQVDPFTEYYPEDDEELRQMATGKYAGIGSAVRFSKKEDRVVISEPYEGTPSQLAGVKAGDVILSINGKDVKGMSTPKVSSMLRGEAGTMFVLRVLRGGKEMEFSITRQTIQIPQVPYYGIVGDGVGYIYLSGFTEGACKEVTQALKDLKGQGAKSLILDLRGNPGGAVNEAVDIVNLFVPKGRKVLYTKGKMAQTNRDYYAAYEPADTLIPLAVMVDGGSASSSEIVSGSLQDMDRAVVIGTRTFGKGLVQMVRETAYHGGFKVTTGRYYIPSGRCIQAWDYRHLNADGSAGTVPDSLTKVFQTAGGREVRDGGGIKPDVEVQPDSLPSLVYDLVSSDEFFDWCTKYANEHASVAAPGEIKVTDEEYSDFVQYVQASGFKYNRRSTEVLSLLRDVAKREGYLQGAESEFAALEAKFQTDIVSDMMRFRKDIEPYLTDEIATRYYYQRGAVKQQLLTDDPCLAKALQILASQSEYDKILGR